MHGEDAGTTLERKDAGACGAMMEAREGEGTRREHSEDMQLYTLCEQGGLVSDKSGEKRTKHGRHNVD